MVVRAGKPIAVSGEWGEPTGPVLISLIRHGNPVTSAVATIGRDGKLAATVQPPEGVFGLASVRAVDLGWDRESGSRSEEIQQASIYIEPAVLDVAIAGKTRFSPGSNAAIDVVVTAAGKPAAGVGLAASVVDERVLALSTPRPDLVSVLRNLDVGGAHAGGLVFANLMRSSDVASRLAMNALVEALPPEPVVPAIRIAAAERLVREHERIDRARQNLYVYLLEDARPLGVRTGDSWEFRSSPADLLGEAGWKRPDQLTPWGEPTSWNYARQLSPDWTFAETAGEIADVRLDRLVTRLQEVRASARGALHRDPERGLQRLVRSKRVAAYLAIDPWGTPIQVRRLDENLGKSRHVIEIASAGPDQMFDTGDDRARYDVFLEGAQAGIGYGYGSGEGYGGGSAYGAIGLGQVGTIGHGAGGMAEATIRRRFDETVLWSVGMLTDESGRASLDVPLADSITGWKVAVEAVSPRGAVGAAETHIETFLPLHVDAQVPDELAVGDRYVLSAVAANHTSGKRALTLSLTTTGGIEREGPRTAAVELPSGTTRAVAFPIDAASVGEGRIELSLVDERGRAIDAVERTIAVAPRGDRVREIRNLELEGGRGRVELAIPTTAVATTMTGRVRVFRGASDQTLDGLESLLAEPHGCFEQTSSTTYPNLLVLRLLKGNPGTAAAIAKARRYVAQGYQRLISYEVSGGGFSWFGESPANQVLTAYGLMEFVDMSSVYPVDKELIDRTRKWLLGKQREDGSWAPDQSWLHDWSEVQGKLSTTAYIAWSLAESGYRGKRLERALGFLRGHSSQLAKDPYVLALWAAAEGASGAKANGALSLLRKKSRKDGATGRSYFSAGDTTLFYAQGRDADMQVTALAVNALSRSRNKEDAREAFAWMWSARDPRYGWGTTQATVLSLRAAALLAGPAAEMAGSLEVTVDGERIGAIDLGAVDVPSLELPRTLSPGAHALEIRGNRAGGLLADVRWSWREADEPKPMARGIEVALEDATPRNRAATQVGEATPLALTLTNPSKEAIAMPTVVIPVPPGFSADTDSLDALVKRDAIEKYSDLGSEIHLYLTSLAPRTMIRLPYQVIAGAEVDVLQRPARAYAYYSPEVAGSSATLRLTSIAQRE